MQSEYNKFMERSEETILQIFYDVALCDHFENENEF